MKQLTKIKMKESVKYLAIIFIALVFTACDDETNSSPSVSFTFKGNTSASTVSAGRSIANTLEFTSGTIKLSRIQFEVETEDVDSVEVEIERVIEIDFATGETSPNLENLVFPIGTYEEARVELELLDENSDPSVVLEGTFTDSDNETHPIRFEFNSGETFEVEKEGRVVFGEGAQVLAEVTFDPVVWFAGVTLEELSSATKNDNGVIVISETSNADIFDIAADGLDLATEVEIKM